MKPMQLLKYSTKKYAQYFVNYPPFYERCFSYPLGSMATVVAIETAPDKTASFKNINSLAFVIWMAPSASELL